MSPTSDPGPALPVPFLARIERVCAAARAPERKTAGQLKTVVLVFLALGVLQTLRGRGLCGTALVSVAVMTAIAGSLWLVCHRLTLRGLDGSRHPAYVLLSDRPGSIRSVTRFTKGGRDLLNFRVGPHDSGTSLDIERAAVPVILVELQRVLPSAFTSAAGGAS